MTERTWPELSDELSRKALESLETWMGRYSEGKITDRELWLVTDALYDTVSGLVGWEDCANVIYQVRQSLGLTISF